MDLLEKTNVGRDINRHYYTSTEIKVQFLNKLVNTNTIASFRSFRRPLWV